MFTSGNKSNYIIAALVAALCAVGGLYKCERDTRIQAERNTAVAVSVNEANVKSLSELQSWKESLDVSIEKLASDRKEIDGLRKELRSGIQTVLKSNEDARKWADTPIPVDFIRMYNAAQNNNTNSDGGKETKSGTPTIP